MNNQHVCYEVCTTIFAWKEIGKIHAPVVDVLEEHIERSSQEGTECWSKPCGCCQSRTVQASSQSFRLTVDPVVICESLDNRWSESPCRTGPDISTNDDK
jgi:hypothetical protein